MATFSVTVPDAVVARIRTAFGHFDNSVPPIWIDGTVADVQAACKALLKSGVLEYEVRAAALTQRDTNNAEVW